MDKALIAQAAQHLKLRSILLFEGNLRRFKEISKPATLGQQNKLGLRAKTGEASEGDRHFHLFQVFVELGVRLVEPPEQEGQEATPLFQIEAVFQVNFELIGEVDQTALQEFARYNVVHNAWPFWRQFVFTTAHQAGLPCPEIPLCTDLQQ